MVSVIHIPDKTYKVPCRILYQYLLLAQGQFHDLKVSCTLIVLPLSLAGEGLFICFVFWQYWGMKSRPPAG
jgi:hypothetical protein